MGRRARTPEPGKIAAAATEALAATLKAAEAIPSKLDKHLATWRVPPHLAAAAPAPSPQQATNAARCHSLMLTADGAMHPMVIFGYLDDPEIPVRAFRDHAHSEIGPAARAPWSTGIKKLEQISVYAAVATPRTDDTFNVLGSYLACELGYEVKPLYGPVFVCRTADPQTKLTTKLTVPMKMMIGYKHETAKLMFERAVRPPHVSEETFAMAWAVMKALVRMHRDGGGDGFGEPDLSPSP